MDVTKASLRCLDSYREGAEPSIELEPATYYELCLTLNDGGQEYAVDISIKVEDGTGIVVDVFDSHQEEDDDDAYLGGTWFTYGEFISKEDKDDL